MLSEPAWRLQSNGNGAFGPRFFWAYNQTCATGFPVRNRLMYEYPEGFGRGGLVRGQKVSKTVTCR
jgi:hypothetical protein